jgi:hypothetical protein
MPTERMAKAFFLGLPVKICVSLLALAALFVHVFMKNDRVDSTAALLLVIAALPWLAELLNTLELPGGWKVSFRDIHIT